MYSGSHSKDIFDYDDSSNMSIGSIVGSIEGNDATSTEPTLEEKIDKMREELSPKTADKNVIEKPSLEVACARRPFLDGTWFKPVLEESSYEEGVFAICQTCKNENNKMSRIKGYVTSMSNYKTHMKACHNKRVAEFDAYCTAKKQCLEGTKACKEQRVTCNFTQSLLDANICNCILSTLIPLSIVDEESFIKIFTDMDIKAGDGKELKVISSSTVKTRTDDIYKEKMAKIKEEIANARYVCTTADIWTSRNRRFMGVTVTWLDELTLERISYALACKRFPESHTHDRIANLLNDIHSSYEITEEKLIGTVTDNGSNFVKAFKEFGINLDESLFYADYNPTNEQEEEPSERELVERIPLSDVSSRLLPAHQRCVSHLANLIATSDLTRGINDIESLKLMYTDVLGKCVKLWNLTRSPKQYEVIVEFLGKSLKRPVVTRWNSFYDAYEQIVQLKDKILSLLDKLVIADSLVPSDFIFLEEYVKCTGPIAKALDRLQGDVIVGYGWLLPTLISAKNDLKELEKQDLIYCKPVIKVLLSSLDKRFSNYFNVFEEGTVAAVAAATHPRFKLKWLHCLDETAQANVMSSIKGAIAAACAKPPTTSTLQMEIDDDDFNFGCREEAILTAQQNLDTGAGETEFRRFCQDKKTELAILLAYPTVRNVFWKSNTLLPSSASVERMFSFATQFDIARFNRLTAVNFEKRVLCKANAVWANPKGKKQKIQKKMHSS